jgi:peroxiredoxin family protein
LSQKKPSICIICFSGDLDKSLSALAMAWTAAGEGFTAHIFFTFWGLALLRKERGRAQNMLERLFKLLLPVGPDKLGLSKMNFGGLGAVFMNKLIRQRKTESVGELLEMAMERQVNFVACQGTLEMLGITESELIDYEHLSVGDVTTFLQLAREAAIQLFI